MRILSLLLVTSLTAATGVAGPDKDYKDVPLKDLGVELVKPMKEEKTGFTIGGKNGTDLIRKLTHINGRTIAQLEKDMRPGAKSEVGSRLGFLGPKESLLEILAEDNDTVLDKLKLTHQDMARHLLVLGAIERKAKKEVDKVLYHGRQFKLSAVHSLGIQLSPFYDDTSTQTVVTVVNTHTGEKLSYSLLVPAMVERYGFYEGKGTPYRVDPQRIVEVLDFLKTK